MSRNITRTALAAALFNAFVINPAAAADEAAIVVVATRQPTRINTLAADITVIEREEIDHAGPTATLGELLARSAGIEFARAGGPGATESIFIRGANSGHTLVLLDGLRLGSATLGETAIEAIPLAQVERIEILRGAGSAVYGSDAIGGVIRITTRQAAATPRLEASLGAGSYGGQEATLAHGGRLGDVAYSLRLADSRATGVNQITNPASPGYNPDKDGFRRHSVALRADWRAAGGAEIGGQWFESDGVSRFDSSWPAANLDWQTRHRVDSFGAHARYRLSEDWTTELRAGRGEDLTVTTPSANIGQERDLFQTRQDQFTWQNDVRLPLGRGLVALETLREQVVSTSVFTNTRRSTDALVLGWNGTAGAHFWQVGARRDENSQFGGKTTGSLGYGYQLTDAWRVSASAGTAFKAPTFNDLYFPNTPFVGVGNPNLQPESGRSREAALRYERGGSSASLTAFRNDIRNLIQWEESPPGSWFYTPRNVGEARITGWTATAQTVLALWTLSASVTAQDPRDHDTGEYLVRRATRFGNLAANRDAGSWSAGIELQGAGARYDAPDFFTKRNTRRLGGYGLVNLRGEFRLPEGWSLFGRVDNLFGKRYELAGSSTSNFATLGTTVFVGARFVLK